jgi:hypothetical protein
MLSGVTYSRSTMVQDVNVRISYCASLYSLELVGRSSN